MKTAIRRWGALLLALLLVSSVCFLFSCRKSGMFIDEIYTYGLSNSHNAPFLKNVLGGTMTDKVMTRGQFMDYMVVNEGEGFDFASVYTNQIADVHPPLYYWLLNMVCSLTPGVFSLWSGLILDYVIYMAALVLLWLLVTELFESRSAAAAAVVMYGLSLLGLNTMLMIRMYVLMTMLTLLMCLSIAKLMKAKSLKWYITLAVSIFLGLLTQYYFVFYAFFLCGFFVLYMLAGKDWKGCVKFALFAFAGVALFIAVFPACFDHLFADKLVSGGNAVENLKDSSQYSERIMYFVAELRHGTKAAVISALVSMVLCLPFAGRFVKCAKAGHIRFEALIFIVPAFITLILVALISPVLDQRYVYNIVPVFVLAVCFVLHVLEKSMPDFKWKELALWGLTGCITLLCVWYARLYPPQYLYQHYLEYDALISAHADAPCVYMTDDYFEPMTQDLMQLAIFPEVFITDSADSAALDSYLEGRGSDECVVYIDTSEFWSSGFDPDEMLPALIDSTEYTAYEALYETGLSAAYLLTK